VEAGCLFGRGSLHELEAVFDLVSALGYLAPEELGVLETTRAD
jgi:hypothetical protein